MRRIACLLIAFGLVAPGCGGGRAEPLQSANAAATPSVRETPDDGGVKPLEPGEYRSTTFRPEVRFRIDRRFWQPQYETEESLSLRDQGNDVDWDTTSWIDVYRPHAIYDPTRPRKGRPWPRDMVRFLREHPDLETTAPRRTKVAGLPARVLDLRPRKDVELWLDSAEQQHYMDRTRLVRVYVIDAGEEERLAVLTVPRRKGPKGFGRLEGIVRTLRFAG